MLGEIKFLSGQQQDAVDLQRGRFQPGCSTCVQVFVFILVWQCLYSGGGGEAGCGGHSQLTNCGGKVFRCRLTG